MSDLIDDLSPKSALRSPKAPSQRTETVRTGSVRRRKGGSQDENVFHIPDDLRAKLEAQGMSAEWKRVTYFGKEEDPDYHISLAENGWEPLGLDSFPEFKKLMPKNWTKNTFEKRGQMLMIRPKELTDEARAEDKANADNQVKGKIASLKESGPGEAERTLVKVNRSYERGVPVE